METLFFKMLVTVITVLLGLTVTISASALPRPALDSKRHNQSHPSHAHHDYFSLSAQVDGAYLPILAVSNGTADLVLQIDEAGDGKQGTPVYTNTRNATSTSSTNDSGYNTSLLFDLTQSTDSAPGVYGLAVSDPGELYGVSFRVFAVLGYQEYDFAIANGFVYHSLTSALQHWFACLDTVNGTQGYFLSWGVFTGSDGAPDGCFVTSVVQTFGNATAT